MFQVCRWSSTWISWSTFSKLHLIKTLYKLLKLNFCSIKFRASFASGHYLFRLFTTSWNNLYSNHTQKCKNYENFQFFPLSSQQLYLCQLTISCTSLPKRMWTYTENRQTKSTKIKRVRQKWEKNENLVHFVQSWFEVKHVSDEPKSIDLCTLNAVEKLRWKLEYSSHAQCEWIKNIRMARKTRRPVWVNRFPFHFNGEKWNFPE